MSRELPKTEEAVLIALTVRRFQVLARPSMGHMTVDDLLDGERRSKVWETLRADGDDGLDALALMQEALEPVDLVCAEAVRKLSKARRGAADVLDVLAVLDADRKVALYYALPADKRAPLESHASFGPIIAPYRDTLDEALFDAERLRETMTAAARDAWESNDPNLLARFVPPRYRSAIPAALRLQEVER